MARKARNRLSSSQLAVPTMDAVDAGGRSHKRRPTVSRRPTHGRVTEEEGEKEKEDKEEAKVAKQDQVDRKPAPQLVIKTG